MHNYLSPLPYLTLLSFCLTACIAGAFPKDKVDPWQEGLRLQRKCRQAMPHFADVPVDHEHYQMAQFNIGACLHKLGEPEKALGVLLKARAINIVAFGANARMLRGLARSFGQSVTTQKYTIGEGVREVYTKGEMLIMLAESGQLSGYDASTKKIAWEISLGRQRQLALRRPVIAGDSIYTLRDPKHGDMELVAIDIVSGSVRWKQTTKLGGEHITVAVGPDAVYVSGKKALRAHAMKDGSLLWSVPFDKLPIRYGQDTVYTNDKVCTYNDQTILCVDAKSGSNAWLYSAPNQDSNTPKMLAHDGILYVASHNALYAIRIGADKPMIWKRAMRSVTAPTLSPDTKSIALHGGNVIISLDRETGEERFSVPGPTAAGSYRKPVRFDEGGNLLVVSGEFVFSLDGETGDTRWIADFDAVILSPPYADSDGSILLTVAPSRGDKSVTRFVAKSW